MSQPPQLQQRLGLFSATTIIIGSMIGSGIFLVPSTMAEYIQTPGLLLGLWIFGGLFTILGALSYAELAAMEPRAGGQYVFLREAFGPFAAFLYGWTLFLVIQTGFNAAVLIAFAKYLGIFLDLPSLSESYKVLKVPLGNRLFVINSAQLAACGVIILLTWINIRGVREGALVQNIFTVLKLAALAALIVVGTTHVFGNASNFQPVFTIVPGSKAMAENLGIGAALAVALSQALFAYDAWNTVTFVAEEVRQPQRTLPRALLLGSMIVTLVYVLTVVAYLAVLPIDQMAEVPGNLVAQPVAIALFGPIGETLIIIAILISTFGCVNGLILGGARVGYAMAREGLFFRSCGILHPRRATPAMALIFQGVWSCVLALTGSYKALLTYTVFASVLFGVLTVAGVFWLRWKQPDRPRPYRCWGYPVTPALYLLIALPFLVYVIQGDPFSTLIGLLLVCTGIPVYLWWRRNGPPLSPSLIEGPGGSGYDHHFGKKAGQQESEKKEGR